MTEPIIIKTPLTLHAPKDNEQETVFAIDPAGMVMFCGNKREVIEAAIRVINSYADQQTVKHSCEQDAFIRDIDLGGLHDRTGDEEQAEAHS